MYKNVGADGVKTGYLGVEKYSLASTIKKDVSELQNYKSELKEMIKFLESEIIKRQDEKIKAEKFFQK